MRFVLCVILQNNVQRVHLSGQIYENIVDNVGKFSVSVMASLKF